MYVSRQGFLLLTGADRNWAWFELLAYTELTKDHIQDIFGVYQA